MSGANSMEQWQKIVKTLDDAGLVDLAVYVCEESNTAHAAPMSIPIIGETGSGKSALVSRIFGDDTAANFPQDVLESTARPVEVKYSRSGYRAVVHDDTDEWEECEDDARWDALVRGKETASDGSRLEVGLRCEDLATWNVIIVDTPGMNTSTLGLEGRAWATAATAPVVILAIPATSAGRKTDLDYLESLGKNSSNVVIVLTKADQLPSDSEGQIIDHFRNLLEERDISPLRILATSVMIEDDERGGIETLRQVLSDVAGIRRDHLVAYHVGGRVATKIQSELSALLLKQSALESDTLTLQKHGRVEERDIVAEGADQEADFRNAIDTLKDRCKRLRLEAFNRMYEIGQDTLETISAEVNPLQTREEVQRFADGSIRRYVLQWREACIAVAEDRLGELDQAGVKIAKDVAARHFEQIGMSTDWLQGLPEGTITNRSDEDLADIENLRHSQKELLRQIGELQKQMPKAEALEDVKQALADTQAERDELVHDHEPKMDKIHIDRGKESSRKVGKIVGMVADVALILAPIPVGKVGFLKKLPKGTKLINGMKKYNNLIAGRDKWLRDLVSGAKHLPNPLQKKLPAVSGGLTKILANLSLETWGERLGEKIGGRLYPDKIVEIENEDVRQEFLKRRKPYDDEVLRLEYEREKIRSQQENFERRLREKHDGLEVIGQQTGRLEQERKDLEVRRQALDTEEQASTAKVALMDQLVRQLLTQDGDSLFADIRNAVSVGFDSAHEELESHLRERVNTIKSEVQAALKEARAKRAQGEVAVKEALENNQMMRSALQDVLTQLEAL